MVTALLLLAPTAAAFGTINTGGQQAEHERITRTALQCPDGVYHADGSCFEPISMLSFAGGNGTFGAIGAPDGGADALKSEAHCDDADYIDYAKWGLSGTYPQSREERNRKLRECYDHMKELWDGGIKGAGELLDDFGALIEKETKLADSEGRGVPCIYSGSLSGRAKCDAFEGLGRALHGLQDFYSHSNWIDAETTPTQSVPPGLGQTELAPFLSMVNGSGPTDANVPADFSTGCFNLFGHDTVEGAAACEKDGRYVTHVVLNKDKGEIRVQPLANVSIASGATLTGEARTPRGNVSDNFERAVRGAVLESRRQWADFRTKILQAYGARQGALIVCALTRDQPQRDCGGGRSIALVLDGSAAAGVGGALKAKAYQTDRVGVFDGRGAFAAFGADAKLDSLQGGSLAKSVQLAVDALNGTATDHIVLVASGDSTDLVKPIEAAKKKSIRVSYGLLAQQGKTRRSLRFWRRADPSPQAAVAAAVLSTGGTYAVLADEAAKDTFAQHVFEWDEATKTRLHRGLTVFDDGDRDWVHDLDDKHTVNVTVTAVNGSVTTVLREDDEERARGKGSTLSLQAEGDDSTVEARVEPDGLYSIALYYTSAAFMAIPSLAPVVIASLAHVLL